MAVSANTLFHFTSNANLKKILASKGFFVQYSDEHFENIIPDGKKYSFAFIPMISFCDLTIMQLSKDSKHTENFGKYGIGLTKDWGIKNRVSPVIYTHEESQPLSQLYNLNQLLNFHVKTGREKKKFSDIRKVMVDFFKYIKPYRGRWHKGERINDKKDDIIYYNEREWRYCPLVSEYKVLLGDSVSNKKQKELFNEELKLQHITFTPDDIKFIVIKQKDEVNSFVKEIKKMKLAPEQENKLITKIISFQQISEDY